MSPLAVFFWLANLVFDTTGHLAFKAAAGRAGDGHGMTYWRAMAADWPLWLGLGAFGIEWALWLSFLSLVPLSQGVLVGSVNIIGVLVGGRLLFGEAITGQRFLGATLVLIGVALAGWGGQ